MYDITVERAAVNLEALDADLRTALGAVVIGVSFGRGIVTVHLTDKSTPADSDTARHIVVNHDPAKLSPGQQAAQDQAARLDAARQANKGNLDTSKFNDPLTSELAQKVAWLEQEIIALRAGR